MELFEIWINQTLERERVEKKMFKEDKKQMWGFQLPASRPNQKKGIEHNSSE